jgi:nucleosome assembly protein 1-like 1
LGILGKLPSDEELAELPKEIAETTKSSGSPNLPGFWGEVLFNSEEFTEFIMDHDRPVLEYLSDVRAEWIDDTTKSGFRLIFKFKENPYFAHQELKKTIHTEPRKFEVENFDVLRTDCDPEEISWRPGKNVTVTTKVDKKKKSSNKKGGGEKTKPQESFFRHFFRNINPKLPLPELHEGLDDSDDDDDMDESDIRSMLLSNDYDEGVALRDNIIPHAIRWYTKEALSDDDSDDDDDDDDDDEDDEEKDKKIIESPWNMSVGSKGGKAKGKGGKGKR